MYASCSAACNDLRRVLAAFRNLHPSVPCKLAMTTGSTGSHFLPCQRRKGNRAAKSQPVSDCYKQSVRSRCQQSTTMPAISVLLLLSVFALSWGEAQDDLVNLHVMGLFPMEGAWSGGEAFLPSVQMGLDHINARDDILQGYNLTMVWEDTKCDPGVGTNGMYRQFYRDPPKMMVIGGGCSIVSEATSQASWLWNVVQISYASVSPSLSNKTRFPRFVRIGAPDTVINPSRIEMMKMFHWNKVATIHQSFELFSKVTDDIVRRFKEENISLISSEIFTDDPSLQVQNLKKQGARIIVAGFYEDKALSVFCEAYKNGLYGPKYVWFVQGWLNDRWWERNDSNVDCTPEQIGMVADGYISTGIVYLDPDDHRGISGLKPSEYLKEFRQRTNNAVLFADNMAPQGYDTAWAVALALNDTINRLKETGNGTDYRLEDFHYDNEVLTTALFENMKRIQFTGVRGPISFDANGDPIGTVKIDRIQGGQKEMVGLFHPSWPVGQQIEWLNGGIPWPGGKVPADSTEEFYEKIFIPVHLYVSMCALSALGMVCALGFLSVNIVFAKERLIKMSSPNLNNVMLVGCILAYITVFCEQLSEGSNGESLCKFRTAGTAIAFSLAFGALFSKTWRVHFIFTHSKPKGKVVKDSHLLVLVASCVVIDCLMLVIWELVDPVKTVTIDAGTEEMEGGDVIIHKQQDICDSKYKTYFTGAFYGIKGLLMLLGAFLAWETRKVYIPALNDSKLIGMSIYNAVVLSVLGVTLKYVTGDDVTMQYGLSSAILILGTSLTFFVIFVPKLIKLKSHRDDQDGQGASENNSKHHLTVSWSVKSKRSVVPAAAAAYSSATNNSVAAGGSDS